MKSSVIIPALNEENFVRRAVDSARHCGADEIVVVDGGSSDRTVEKAETGAIVIKASRGRALQMNAGARMASGDLLIFLHADSRLPAGALDLVSLAMDDGADAGCFRLRFEPDSPLLRFCAGFTALPMRSLCFGDRGLFVRRTSFDAVGGFADIPAFEDLDLVERLHRNGRFVMLPDAVVTSSRRFEQHGFVRQQAVNLLLWTAYHLGFSPEALSSYYRYGSDG